MSDDADQSPVQKSLRKPLDLLADFKKFWKTKKAVTTGVPLYDWTPFQRKEEGFLGPWSLNIQETVFATLPALVVVNALDFLFGKPQIQIPGFDQLDRRTQVFVETVTSTNQFFNAFTAPTLITLLVFLIGWGSLKTEDANKETRARARQAYLYLDGAHGLFSQCALAVAFSLLAWVLVRPEIRERLLFEWGLVTLAWVVLLAFGFLTQMYLTFNKIPKLVFQANGYSGRVRRFRQKRLSDDPPWNKYGLALVIGGWPCILVIYVVLTGLSWVTAWFLTAVKMLVVG